MYIKSSILFVLFQLIEYLLSIPSDSYYLIDIDRNFSLNYCLNRLINKNAYRLPDECHQHVYCNRYNCDDKSFRCIKLRETLCCLYKYLKKTCQNQLLKDQFRLIYFHLSIEHGYCEINLERIEQTDHSYCLTNPNQPKKKSLLIQNVHRFTNKSSKFSFISMNFIIFILIIVILNK